MTTFAPRPQATMTTRTLLEVNRVELARFVDATFRYAEHGTDAVLRTFAEGSNEVLGTVRVRLNGAGFEPLNEHAVRQATKAANAARPAVSLRRRLRPSSAIAHVSEISETASS